MTIASEISKLQRNITNAYNAISEKGGTVPAQKNMDNLATAVESISSGGGSSSKYGVTIDNFLGDVDANGVLQDPITPMNLTFNGVKSLGTKLSNAFYQNKNVGEVVFPDLEDVSLFYALGSTFGYSSTTKALFPKLNTVTGSSAFSQTFNNAVVSEVDFSSLTSITGSFSFQHTFISCKIKNLEFPKLTTITGTNFQSCFNSNISLETVSFPKLTSIQSFNNTFAYCSGLTTVSFPELATITQSSSGLQDCFSGCSSLVSITFPKLSYVGGGNCFWRTFQNCTSLKDIYFPALNSQSFNNYTSFGYSMLKGVTGCTVHFPKKLESVIGSWSDVQNGFDGTNTVVLFDLVEPRWIKSEYVMGKLDPEVGGMIGSFYTAEWSPFTSMQDAMAYVGQGSVMNSLTYKFTSDSGSVVEAAYVPDGTETIPGDFSLWFVVTDSNENKKYISVDDTVITYNDDYTVMNWSYTNSGDSYSGSFELPNNTSEADLAPVQCTSTLHNGVEDGTTEIYIKFIEE